MEQTYKSLQTLMSTVNRVPTAQGNRDNVPKEFLSEKT